MRTRIYNKMTTPEVEAYLARGGDTMFIAVGVVECHGNLPIDCETIGPEAYCKLLAEKADGLAMVNLPYFYPGGTVISNATVQLTVRDGIDYLMKICHSLVDQGFKRLFLVSGHGPAPLTINAFCWDFFEETLIHPCHLMHIGQKAMSVGKIDPEKGPTPEQIAQFKAMSNKWYGAYKVMDQMHYLPVDPDFPEEMQEYRQEINPAMSKFMACYKEFGGYTSQIYSDPAQHGGGRVFRSEEERLEACTIGEEILRKEVDSCGILELKEALGEYQAYVQEMYKKFPRIKRK